MELLRRIFGLQPAPAPQQDASPASPESGGGVNLEGPTAPLARSPFKDPPVVPLAGNATMEAVATIPKEDLYKTDLFEDEGDGGLTRKLDEESITRKDGASTRLFFVGFQSDPGQVRTNNQDSIYTFSASAISVDGQPNFGLFIVADGMGGHHDGEKASSEAAKTVVLHISNEIFVPMIYPEDTGAERPTITEILRQAFQKANEVVSSKVPEGGTTITAAAIMGDLAYIAHVGDSRAYLISSDRIEQLTRDHSLVQRLIELDQLTPEEAAEHPQRNVLYRAIGQSENVDADAITRRLPPGSRLLLCSDGLWNMVSEEELRNTVFSSATPQSACETLIKLANERGGPDNISVVIVKMPDAS